MRLDSLLRDKISIFDEQGNLITENQKASVQNGNTVITQNADFIVDIGYLVKRELPNGHTENYCVLESNFRSGIQGIKSHYQMKVKNVKLITPTPTSVVNNHITITDNARLYQNSTDHSINTNTTYISPQYKELLDAINNQINQLNLQQSERDLIKHSLDKIECELRKTTPNKDVLSTCISFLPTSIATLESVINLGKLLGIS